MTRCLDCHRPILPKRLAAIPGVEVCAACQSRYERQHGTIYRAGEDGHLLRGHTASYRGYCAHGDIADDMPGLRWPGDAAYATSYSHMRRGYEPCA